MFIKIHKNRGISGVNNKGSSDKIIEYLSKENEDKEWKDHEHFFNHDKDKIIESKAITLIDSMNKNIAKKDGKFYMFTINPSEREQQHLLKAAGIKRNVNSINQLNKEEKEKYAVLLKSYTKNVMELYARNFNKGIKGKDLVYVAKIEHTRTYKSFSKEVKFNEALTKKIISKKLQILELKDKGVNFIKIAKAEREKNTLVSQYLTIDGKKVKEDRSNIIKRNALKTGLNSHVHIVVHRNTKDYVKISPHGNSKGHIQKNQSGKNVSIGFNHETFKENANEMFKAQFKYKPLEKEIYVSQQKQDIRIDYLRNKIQSQAKGEIKKHVTNDEYERIRRTSIETKSVIKTLAKATNPKTLLMDITKKGFQKVVQHTRI